MQNYLQRINMDSCWLLQLEGTRLLIDPWITGSETDGFKWLNRQWHVHEVMDPANLPGFDAILITQPYDDHCHIASLQLIAGDKPILADRRASAKIRRHLKNVRLITLDEKTRAKTQFHNVSLYISPTDKLYNGCVIEGGGHTLLYLPHGIEMKPRYLKHFPTQADVVLSSASTFRLPFWLGGLVAKGIANIQEIQQHFAPRSIYTTHDEPKEGVGLVSVFARKHYPTQAELDAATGGTACIIRGHAATAF